MKVRYKYLTLLMILVLTRPCSGAFHLQVVQRLPGFSPERQLPEALYYNPASVSLIQKLVLGGQITDLFNLRFLRRQSGILGVPTAIGKFGVAFLQFGDSHYLEQTYSFCYGLRLAGPARLGIAVHSYQLTIPQYGRAGTYGIDLGGHWQVTPDLEWELAYTNINQTRLKRTGELLPQQIYAALQYTPLDAVTGHTYLVHELGYPIRYGIGLAYKPVRWIDVAIDLITTPVRGNVGINLDWRFVQLYYVLSSHSVLPITHRFGMLFTF